MSQMTTYLSPIEILGSYLNQAPVDVEAIADALALIVEKKSDWPESISGRIERVGQTYRIKINAMHGVTRQRFTLAHEIAHYILHRDMIGDGITDDGMYRSGQPSYIETEANQYAAGILMPAPLMRTYWRNGARSYAEFGAAFGVSTKAAEIRMKELKL